MKTVSIIGDNLHEMLKPIFWKKIKKNVSNSFLLKILPGVLSVKGKNLSTGKFATVRFIWNFYIKSKNS